MKFLLWRLDCTPKYDTIEERDRLPTARRRFRRRRSLRDRLDSERKNGDEEEG